MRRVLHPVIAVLTVLAACVLMYFLAPSSIPHTAGTDQLAAAGNLLLTTTDTTAGTIDLLGQTGDTLNQVPVIGQWLADVAGNTTQGLSNGIYPYWMQVGVGLGTDLTKTNVHAVTVELVTAPTVWLALAGITVLTALGVSIYLAVSIPQRRLAVGAVAFSYRLVHVVWWFTFVYLTVINPFSRYLLDKQQPFIIGLTTVAVCAGLLVAGTGLYAVYGWLLQKAAGQPYRLSAMAASAAINTACVIGVIVAFSVGVYVIGFIPGTQTLQALYVNTMIVISTLTVAGAYRDMYLLRPTREPTGTFSSTPDTCM